MLPSTRTRVYPARRAASSSLAWVPLRPRTTGASTWKRVRSGRRMTSSTISSTLCWLMGRPQTGQCGTPMRAYRRRR